MRYKFVRALRYFRFFDVEKIMIRTFYFALTKQMYKKEAKSLSVILLVALCYIYETRISSASWP